MRSRCAVGDLLGGPVRGARSCTDICCSTNRFSINSEPIEATFSHLSLNVPVVQGDFEERNVLVWRLPHNISQSLLAGRRHSSNACTIISLKIVEYLHANNILFPSLKLESRGQYLLLRMRINKAFQTSEFPCPGRIMNCMANAIVEGNEIHERAVLRRNNSRKNFNIPEALHVTKNGCYEMDYCSVRGSIRQNLPTFLMSAIYSEALSPFDQLFFLLIVVEQCVVIVYQRTGDLIGFFDSHLHPPNGAVISCTTLENLDRFCCWLVNRIFADVAFLDFSLQSFELSSICRLHRSPRTLSQTRRRSVFPALAPDQTLTYEARVRAHQIVSKRRRERMRQLRQEERYNRVAQNYAQMSASLPFML